MFLELSNLRKRFADIEAVKGMESDGIQLRVDATSTLASAMQQVRTIASVGRK